ncbi:MAG: DUF4382 domain-containing protein [Candidatus Aminicenantes bacterium]|nr:MAG: DUF4382 domain-containing protein [Candidatus Aminicenantes bacterium]
MKKWGILFGIFVCLVLIFAVNCKSPASSEAALPFTGPETESGSSSNTSSTTTNLGSLVIKLKDNPVEEAAEILVTIDKIRVHKASPENFIIVLEEELPPVNLLALQDTPLTIVDGELGAGHYNQIRMRVVAGTIVFMEDEKPIGYEMKIPSNEIKIPVQFKIEENATLQIILDFDAIESIKVSKQGKGKKEGEDTYTMRPVIKVEGMKKINNS